MIPSILNKVTQKDSLGLANNLINKSCSPKDLEKVFRRYLEMPYAIYTSSGINSLYLLIKSYGLEKDNEVAIPAFGCETVARLLYDLKLKPLYIDTKYRDCNISISDLSEKVTTETKAIIPAHMFGNPCEMKSILDIGEDYKIPIIEDSCQSLGSRYKGKLTGTLGDSGFYSFNFGKPISMGGGGLIVTGDRKIARKCHNLLRSFSSPTYFSETKRLSKILFSSFFSKPNFYEIIYPKLVNYRIRRRNHLKKQKQEKFYQKKPTTLTSSLGINKLKNLENVNKDKINIAERYKINFRNYEKIGLPQVQSNSKPPFTRYPIYLGNDKENKNISKTIESLSEAGFDITNPYPSPVPHFFGKKINLPNSKDLASRLLVLPTHSIMNQDKIDELSSIIINTK